MKKCLPIILTLIVFNLAAFGQSQIPVMFTDIAKQSGLTEPTIYGGLTTKKYIIETNGCGVAFFDFDNDNWTDIFVISGTKLEGFAKGQEPTNRLYKNNKNGTFTDVTEKSGLHRTGWGSSVTVGDYDNNGFSDIFKTHFADDLPILYKNSGRDFYDDASRLAGFDHTRYVQWGTGFADFDNDGWADLLTVTGNVYPEVEKYFKEYPHRSLRLLYQNLGNGKFKDVSATGGTGISEPKSSRGSAYGDFDNDGDVDVLVMNMNEPPLLLRNDLKSANNWLKIKLIGVKSNRSAIGSRVIIKNGNSLQMQEVTAQTSYYSHNDFRLHFGIGSNKQAESIEIRWASGQTEIIKNVSANQFVTVKEGSGIVK
jgi:enediyne biosynthesis protein E4